MSKRFLVLGSLFFGLVAMAPLAWSMNYTSSQDHKMLILDNGVQAFSERLRMIDEAKDHIYLEYFIFSPHKTTEILVRKLIQKAEQGVDVRILLDRSFAMHFDDFFAAHLQAHGVKVRFYNDVSMLRIIEAQFRNHRKLISVDGNQAIVGGRNIENDYYDLPGNYQYRDRDI